MNIIDIIKEIAHSVSEGYIFCKEDTNEAIIQKAIEQDLNAEIIKRICEQVNQNIYLSLFNDPSVNKANIEFDMADYDKIMEKIKQSELAMNDYMIVPSSFKKNKLGTNSEEIFKSIDIDQADDSAISPTQSEMNVTASFHELALEQQKLNNFEKSIETIKLAEARNAENAFNQIFHDCKIMVSNGESIGDMAKIAMRYTKQLDCDMTKIAKIYDLINEELKKSGFTVNEEITKTSSLAVNTKSELLKPVKEYSLSLVKIAACSDMQKNIKAKKMNVANKIKTYQGKK